MFELLLLPDTFEIIRQAIEWANQDGASMLWALIGLVLFLSGIGLPLPEDIPLILAGFLAFQAGFWGVSPDLQAFMFHHFLLAFLYCSTAILAGDSLCWLMGKRWGVSIRQKVPLLRRLLTDDRLQSVEKWFNRFGNAAVFFGRQLAGVRFVTFFTAGTVKMPYWRFLLWDGIGALLSVPLWLCLGALGNLYFEDLEEWILNTQRGVLIAASAGFLGLIAYFYYMRKRRKGSIG